MDKVNKRVLHIGTGLIWGGVLIGVSLLTDGGENANLDWPLMWLIIGGFLLQSVLINAFIKHHTK